MDAEIKAALKKLLPGFGQATQQSLVNDVKSLHAQSKQALANLKPNEEAARVYGCAHLACERAIKRLQLPDPHPESAPIPPKLYKALYAKAKNALKPQPIHKAKKAGHEDLSSQLKREVNVICTKLGGTTIADAVLKTSIWACERKESRKTDADRPAVLSAVYLLVATYCKEQQRLEKEQQKLHKERQKREQQIIHGEQSREQSGDDSTPVKPKSQQAAASTSSAPQKIGKKEKSRVLATLEGQVEDFKLDRWIEIIESEIREDDYFLILYPPKPVRTPKKAAIEPDTVHKEDTEDSVMATPSKRKAVYELPNPRIMPCQVTFSGVGSMLNAKFDYLSKKRVLAYEEWERRIIARLDVLENSKAKD